MTATDRINAAIYSKAIKAPCIAATAANITLSGLQTIDGVVLAADDRVLVKDQTDASENGIYSADSSSWTRTPDFDGASDIEAGTVVFVSGGDSNLDYWYLSTSGTIGTDNLAFSRLVPLEALIVACSDESTALAAGTAKVTFRMPYQLDLSEVRASLTTPQTSGNIFTVDINMDGTSILSTTLTIDNGEKTSTTAATATAISTTTLTDDASITIDIDQIGDGTATGLKVMLIGKKS